MVRMLEHSRGHYERREVPCGTEYIGRPERCVIECGCGERIIFLCFLINSRCLCDADLAASVRRMLGARTGRERNANYPWRPSYRAWSSASSNREHEAWQELRALE
jgi:hypothetical protein